MNVCVGMYSGEKFLLDCLSAFSDNSAAIPELFQTYLRNSWIMHVKIC